MPETVTVAVAIGRTLARLGVAHIFGVVGSGNFHATNALIDGGVPFTAARHEMGATCMAVAYARATGKPVVVSLHQGCGLTNAFTGIGEAAKCRTPILVISGDTPGYATTSNFWIDQDRAVEAIGATAERIHRAATAIDDTYRAYVRCVIDRRTVVLSMPIDLQEELIEWDDSLVPLLPEKLAAGPSPESVARLADALVAADRPVIVGGRGAWGAVPELLQLAQASRALLTTSAAGRGLFHTDPWHLDVMGGFATDGAAELIEEADLVVAFGAALNRWTTRAGHLLRDKTVIQVDDTREAIGRHHPVDLGVLGDAAIVAASTTAELDRRGGIPGEGYRTPTTATRVADSLDWGDQPYDDQGDESHIDPRALTNALDDMLPMERIVVPDGGNFNAYPAMLFRVPDQQGYCVPLAFQSIGLALASGIGAGVAFPERMPIVGVGDGGFMMTHVELDTAVRLGMGMVVVVYNDSAYGAEVQHFKFTTDQLDTVTFPETDIAAIARGYGCEAITARRVEDLAAVETWLAGPRNRPLVIDAKTAAFPSWVMSHVAEVGG